MPPRPPAPPPHPSTAAEAAAYISAAAFSDAKSGGAVVVQRYGSTVFTRYSAGYGNAAHALASGTKSFSCAIEGFAEQDGLLKLTDRAASVITDWAADNKRSSVTLLDLLSLQSGLTGNLDCLAAAASTLDTYRLGVADTQTYSPGQAFSCTTRSPFSSSRCISRFGRAVPMRPAGRSTAAPTRSPISRPGCSRPSASPPPPMPGSVTSGARRKMAGGANFTATDWLKYGQFALQRGTWQSSSLLPAATIDQCTSAYKNPAYFGYGISWWLNAHNNGTFDALDRVPSDGAPQDGSDQFAPHAPVDTYMAAGTGKERL